MLRKFKDALNILLRKFRKKSDSTKPADTLDILGIAIDYVFPEPNKPMVVQVGACDGITGDPIYKHIRRRQLPAILVEPIPESNVRLRKTYAEFPNVQIVQAAISQADTNHLIYRVREQASVNGTADSGGWGPQLASFNKKHLLRHGVPEGDIEAITVPGMTLQTLLAKNAVNQVGILQVDVEGFDDQVVAMALVLEKPPMIIHFEHFHLPQRRLSEILDKLKQCGYRWVTLEMNVLAIKDVP